MQSHLSKQLIQNHAHSLQCILEVGTVYLFFLYPQYMPSIYAELSVATLYSKSLKMPCKAFQNKCQILLFLLLLSLIRSDAKEGVMGGGPLLFSQPTLSLPQEFCYLHIAFYIVVIIIILSFSL